MRLVAHGVNLTALGVGLWRSHNGVEGRGHYGRVDYDLHGRSPALWAATNVHEAGVNVTDDCSRAGRRIEAGIRNLPPAAPRLVHPLLCVMENVLSSILDNGPQVVTVITSEQVIDSYGNTTRQPIGPAVIVRCSLSPLGSSRDAAGRIEERWKLMTRDAPIDMHSRVETENNRFCVDEVKRFDHSPDTAHIEVILRKEY
jgi:hypothetical protein